MTNRLTLEQAQLLLNDHLGESVRLEIRHASVGEPMFKARGRLQGWGAEFGQNIDPGLRDDDALIYWLDSPNCMIDLGRFEQADVVVCGDEQTGIAISTAGLFLNLYWQVSGQEQPDAH